MNYLKQYGTKTRIFQEGGMAPAGAEAQPAPAAGPEQGGGEEQIFALAEAAVAGDQAAAAELGLMLAPMILQEAQAQAGGQPEAAEAQPVFSKGGKFGKKV